METTTTTSTGIPIRQIDGSISRQNVESSNVASVGYSSASQRIQVEFKNGGIYEYDGVPGETFKELKTVIDSNLSVGSFIRHNVIKNPNIQTYKVSE